jgi:hypothetical protein
LQERDRSDVGDLADVQLLDGFWVPAHLVKVIGSPEEIAVVRGLRSGTTSIERAARFRSAVADSLDAGG